MKEYPKIKTLLERDPATHKISPGAYWYNKDSCFHVLFRLPWRFTEKVDGTNIRVIWDGEKVTFKGRTDKASLPAKLVERLQDRFMSSCATKAFRDLYPQGVTLYGEGYGAGIQAAGAGYRETQDFILFDVKVHQKWLDWQEITDCSFTFALDVVPTVGCGTLDDMVSIVREGFVSHISPTVQAEGIVARLDKELEHHGERVLCKLKTKDFA